MKDVILRIKKDDYDKLVTARVIYKCFDGSVKETYLLTSKVFANGEAVYEEIEWTLKQGTLLKVVEE